MKMDKFKWFCSFSTLGDFKFPCQKKSSNRIFNPCCLLGRGFHGMAAVGRGAQLHPLRRVHAVHAAGTGMQHGVHARLFRATDGDACGHFFTPKNPRPPGKRNKTKEDLCGIFQCFCLACFFMGKITLKGKRERFVEKGQGYLWLMQTRNYWYICWLYTWDVNPSDDIMRTPLPTNRST